MAVMAMAAMVDTDTARGPLMLSPLLRPSPRLMPPQLPTTAMAALAAMEVMEAMADTDMARGPLMPRPTMVPDTDMAVMEVMAVVCTDTARGPLTLTTAMVVMVVTAVATDTAMASNSFKSLHNILKPNCHPNHISEKFILYRRSGK